MSRRLTERLGSLRLTVWLLGALGALFLLGVLIPQTGGLKRGAYAAWAQEMPRLVWLLDALGLTSIHRSALA
ncbi:MAG TPA: hypothetical protein VLT61_15235, partial [Anaeromyxobacteraceae bacterium]|nr:hypothetical protein [Anaeromyxobacteraceae bacterium]